MSQRPTDEVPSDDAATAYREALRGRLAADGCEVSTTAWSDRQVVLGSRSDRKARWLGTKSELFVFAAVVPEVDTESLDEFTRWAMSYAKHLRAGLPGARNAATVLPALISGNVRPAASQWAAMDARLLGTDLISRPITVHTVAPGSARVTLYQGGVVYGGMFTRHVLAKSSLYFR